MAAQFLKDGYAYTQLCHYVKVMRDLQNGGEAYDTIKEKNPASLEKFDKMKKEGSISMTAFRDVIKANSAILGFGKSIDDNTLGQMAAAARTIEKDANGNALDIPSLAAVTAKRREYDQKLVNNIDKAEESYGKTNQEFKDAKKDKNKKRRSRFGRFLGVLGAVALTAGFFGAIASSVYVLGTIAAGATMGPLGIVASVVFGVGFIDFFSGRNIIAGLGKLIGHAHKKYKEAKADYIVSKDAFSKKKAANKAANKHMENLQETRRQDIKNEENKATSFSAFDSSYDVNDVAVQKEGEHVQAATNRPLTFGANNAAEDDYMARKAEAEKAAAEAAAKAEAEKSKKDEETVETEDKGTDHKESDKEEKPADEKTEDGKTSEESEDKKSEEKKEDKPAENTENSESYKPVTDEEINKFKNADAAAANDKPISANDIAKIKAIEEEVKNPSSRGNALSGLESGVINPSINKETLSEDKVEEGEQKNLTESKNDTKKTRRGFFGKIFRRKEKENEAAGDFIGKGAVTIGKPLRGYTSIKNQKKEEKTIEEKPAESGSININEFGEIIRDSKGKTNDKVDATIPTFTPPEEVVDKESTESKNVDTKKKKDKETVGDFITNGKTIRKPLYNPIKNAKQSSEDQSKPSVTRVTKEEIEKVNQADAVKEDPKKISEEKSTEDVEEERIPTSYEDAVKFIQEHGNLEKKQDGSLKIIGPLQKKFMISYKEAKALAEQMAKNGVFDENGVLKTIGDDGQEQGEE